VTVFYMAKAHNYIVMIANLGLGIKLSEKMPNVYKYQDGDAFDVRFYISTVYIDTTTCHTDQLYNRTFDF